MRTIGKIKCLIWDLDGTIWHGTLLEAGNVELKEGIFDIIRTLDERGVIQSIASKNDHHVAWPILESFDLAQYFLYPQIGWSSKADYVQAIATNLGIGLDAIAFIDDRIEEREEVKYFLPNVTVIDAAEFRTLLTLDCLQPRVITTDARERRKMYQAEIARTEAEGKFTGTREKFLRTLGMQMAVVPATKADLSRVEELTLRANQLNTTGRTYSHEELEILCDSSKHLLLVAKLDDRYGTYGTVGLTLVEKDSTAWTIRLFIMSCRVMTRGVGNVLLGYLLRLAAKSEVRLQADFVHTDRNRQMYMTYKFAGFRELNASSGFALLEHDLTRVAPYPNYVSLTDEQSQLQPSLRAVNT